MPLLTIDLKKIEENAGLIVTACAKSGLEVIGVTKGTFGDPLVAAAMIRGGASGLADSQILTLKRLKEAGFNDILMLKQPTKGEAEAAVSFSDSALISDPYILSHLNKAAKTAKKRYKIGVMVETGGLREGAPLEKALDLATEVTTFDNLELAGIATNRCPPSEGAREDDEEEFEPNMSGLKALAKLAQTNEDKTGRKLDFVSGGSSSLYKNIEGDGVPKGVDQVRIGEAILLGQETSRFEPIGGAHRDAFIIEAEVLEAYEKRRDGKSIKQAVLSIGKQHIGGGILKPLFEGEVLQIGADHLVVDVSRVDKIAPGDILNFIPGYYALSAAFASRLVEKEFR